MTRQHDADLSARDANAAAGYTSPVSSSPDAGFPPTIPPPTIGRGTGAGAPSSSSSTANREVSRLLCAVFSGLLASQWLGWWPALLVALVVFFATRIGGD